MIRSGVTVTGSKCGVYKIIIEIDKVRDGLFPDCIGSVVIELPDSQSELTKQIESAVKRTIVKYNKELKTSAP